MTTVTEPSTNEVTPAEAGPTKSVTAAELGGVAEPVTAADVEAGPVAVVIELAAHQVAQHPGNVRDASRGIKALTASVAEVGVLVPLIVVPVDQVPGHDFPPGVTHVAVDGNRRQAAAAAAGLPVPCIVRPDLALAKATVRTMAVTGLMRDGLTITEEANAVAALFDAKMSGAAIGRALGRTTAEVKTARRAAQVRPEISEAAEYPLTLDQLAVLADYQDDEQATAALLEAAPYGRMDHVVARLQADAAEAAAIAAALAPVTAELRAAGVIVLDEPPNLRTGDDTGARDVQDLADPAGEDDWEPLTEETHATCPGHAVYLTAEYYPADPEADEPESVEVYRTAVCVDAIGNGHLSTRWADRSFPFHTKYRADQGGAIGAGHAGPDWEARAAAEAAAEEQKKADRRDLISRNKLADSAEKVRHDFLRRVMSVKSKHKAMAGWALEQVVRRDPTFCRWAGEYYSRSVLLTELVGTHDANAAADNAAAGRHGVILWAQVVTANEKDLPRDAHRQKSRSRAAYLTHLQSLGYVLAEVEELIIANVATASPNTDEPNTDNEDQAPADESAGDDTEAAPADEVAGNADTDKKAGDEAPAREVTAA